MTVTSKYASTQVRRKEMKLSKMMNKHKKILKISKKKKTDKEIRKVKRKIAEA